MPRARAAVLHLLHPNMTAVIAARSLWDRYPVLGLVACAGGGALCDLLGTPLPWMIGSLCTMALLRFSGSRIRAPRGSRVTGQILIATALGLYFSPTVAREVLGHWEVIIATAVIAMALAYVSALVLAHVGGVDRTTALFASVPGGASEMAALGDRFGAKVDRIAVAQSLRVLAVVIVVPFAMAAWGVHGADDTYSPPAVAFDGVRLLALLALATLGGAVLQLLRLPNAFMLGPLLVVIALTASGSEWSSIPGWALGAAQVLLGCALGQRFEREFVQAAPRFLTGAVLSIGVAMGIAALCAFILARLVPVASATMVLVTAPGGIAEMCLTAKALQLGVPLVTAAHVARVVFLVTLTVPIFRLVRGLLRLLDRR